MFNKALQAKRITSKLTTNQNEALLRLFKICPIDNKFNELVDQYDALKNGLVFVNEDGDIIQEVSDKTFYIANFFYGSDARIFNETFYKSFSTVRDTDPLLLLIDQIAHYFTTYGAEALGINIPTYVPLQRLDVPENIFNKEFRFTVIQLLSQEKCIERFNKYLKNVKAPSQFLVSFIETLLPLYIDDTNTIKSFEIQIMKHKMDGTIPNTAVSQLRYAVYNATGETLLIKNKRLRTSIKDCPTNDTIKIFNQCDETKLAEIFLRFKPLFLAFKTHPGCAPFINRLRRLAVVYHEPLSDLAVQNYTNIDSATKRGFILNKASNRDLIKILNSISSRILIDPAPAVYNIRNGSTFVKNNGLVPNRDKYEALYDEVKDALLLRLSGSLFGQTFYIPSYIEYAAPTTEKQFVGNIPYGSRILYETSDDGVVIGIHWFNQNNERVDFDLHMNSKDAHFGWNASYSDVCHGIIYSGDQTDAPRPHGAAEAYWFKPTDNELFIVAVYLYSGPEEAEYQIFMTHESKITIDKNYVFNPNKQIFSPIPIKMAPHTENMSLGLFTPHEFFFYGGSTGNGIVPRDNLKDFLDGLLIQLRTKVSLEEILKDSGANIIDTLDELTEEEIAKVISLAPKDLATDTLINIIDGNI